MAYLTEHERQNKFIRLVGGRAKAEELYRIWTNTYPQWCSIGDELPRNHTKMEVFLAKAKREGFTMKQINAFLAI